MKIFVKFLLAGIVLVKNNFAREEQPLTEPQTPTIFIPLQELEPCPRASDNPIEWKDEFLTGDYLSIEVPSISIDRKALMLRRARFYKEVIFSRPQDCFNLDSSGGSMRLIYKNSTSQSHFSGSLLTGYTNFGNKVELVFFLKSLHNMVLRDFSRGAMIKALLHSLEEEILLREN